MCQSVDYSTAANRWFSSDLLIVLLRSRSLFRNFGSCRSWDPSMKCSCASKALSRFSLQVELLAFSIMADIMISFLDMLFVLRCSSHTSSYNASRALPGTMDRQVENFPPESVMKESLHHLPHISFAVCIPLWSTLPIQKAPWWWSRVSENGLAKKGRCQWSG